ncbi:MAG: hypothetical protein AB7I25_04205 [Vicinamibacterales bacterium]
MARLRDQIRRALLRLGDIARGLGRPARGGCFGDPVAWEFDHQQRARERARCQSERRWT